MKLNAGERRQIVMKLHLAKARTLILTQFQEVFNEHLFHYLPARKLPNKATKVVFSLTRLQECN